MKVVEGKSMLGWFDWAMADGKRLVAEERDVRVWQDNGVSCFGSLCAASVLDQSVTIRTYGNSVSQISIRFFTITKIEVFDSRRLRPDRAYAQMKEMEAIIRPSIPIDDSCP